MKLKVIASNMTELELDNGCTVLFSYSTPVAALLSAGGIVYTSKHHSVTTSRHINKWIGVAAAEAVDQSVLDSLGGGGYEEG